jgi:hypothetical protein
MSQKTDTQVLVNEITNFVNTFSLKSDEFTAEMSREHRTLQQSFTRLCLAWIEHCASDDYRYDLRNEDSHTICKTLVESFRKAMSCRLDDSDPGANLPNWLSYI